MATSQTTNIHLVKPDYTEIGDVDVINDNMDIIDGAVGAINTSLGGKKSTQSAKSDPTASGTSLTFIDSLTQNANGEVTATKKTVKDMIGASASAAGAHGLVPQPAAGNNGKYLRGDGTWQTPPNTTYGAATSSSLGLIKTGYTASGKNYPVLLDGNGNAYVLVPWTDTNTTYSEATSSTYGLIKTGYSASGKNYPVALSGGKAYVNVPWTDTTYGEASSSAYGLIKTGYTASGKNYPVALSSGKAYVNVPWTDTNTWRGFQVKEFSVSNLSVSANGTYSFWATAFTPPTGYTPVALAKASISNASCYFTMIDITASGQVNAVTIKNATASAVTGVTVVIKILYLQS